MTNKEKLQTQIIIAQSIGIAPDAISAIDVKRNRFVFYALDKFKGHNIVVAFDKIPTIIEARDKIKDAYLCGVEWDFDEEFDDDEEFI